MFYPIMMNINEKEILIVGGGKVAYRKAKKILEYGGILTILSPEISDEFKELKYIYKNKLNYIYNQYDKKYIENKFLVIATTSSKIINKDIGYDCKGLNILVNIADNKEESDFITPAVMSNDNLTISICTMGSFPYLSKKIRIEMEEKYSKFNKEYMDILEELRYLILYKKPEIMRGEMEKALNLDLDELKHFLESYKKDL